MRSYTIIGTGGLGGFYGCSLHLAGFDVRFLLHSDAAVGCREGLRYCSAGIEHHIPPTACYGDSAALPISDVVCVCLKTTANAQLPELLRACCGPETLMVVMQNGLGIDEQISAMFPDQAIIGASCFLCAHKAGPAHIVHEDQGRLELATATASANAHLQAIADDFIQAGIATELCPELGLLRWRKLVWNIPFNGLCTILDQPTAILLANEAMAAEAEGLMWEVVTAAGACGHAIDAALITRMLKATAGMPPYRPSMQLDYLSGRPLELDAMYREPLRRAAAAGCAMPKTALLTAQLSVLDDLLSRKRSAG